MSKKQEIEVIVTRKYTEDHEDKDALLNAFIRVIITKLKNEQKIDTFDNDAQPFDND